MRTLVLVILAALSAAVGLVYFGVRAFPICEDHEREADWV